MGLAERSDSLIIVVSEERGEVTLAHDRKLNVMPGPEELAQALSKFQEQPKRSVGTILRQALFSDARLKAAAVGLAAILWLVTFVSVGTTVRTANVPVVLVGVPRSLEIAQQSAATIEVRLRGSQWLFEQSRINTLEARFDLSDKKQGTYKLAVKPSLEDLPFGVSIESVNPDIISVRLVQR